MQHNSSASQNLTNSNFQSIYDLVDFIARDHCRQKIRVTRSLNVDEKYCDLPKTANYSKNDSLLTKMYTKYTKKWVDVYSWHVYRLFLNGRLCKTCVLFDIPDARNRKTFVKESFSKPHLTMKIAEHKMM